MDFPRFAVPLSALLLAGCATTLGGGGSDSEANKRQRPPVDVQGHRGARGLLPENTLPAFSLAVELGVTTLEMDLGVTADGVVVVNHDSRVSRAHCRRPGEPSSRAPLPLLRDLNLEEIQTYDCGSLNPQPLRFPSPPRRRAPGARIPTLRAVLRQAARQGDADLRFNLEIKAGPQEENTVPLPEFVAAALRVIREEGVATRTSIQSFHWRALELSKDLAPEVRTVALLSWDTAGADTSKPSPWLNGLSLAGDASLLDLLQAASPYVDDFSPHWHLVTPRKEHYLGSSVKELRAAGFAVIPWTVNRKARMVELLELGVDGLITDYPDVLLDLLREEGIPAL